AHEMRHCAVFLFLSVAQSSTTVFSTLSLHDALPISSHGVQYLIAAVVLAGVLQLLVGVFKLGKFVRLIPQPVMYGFLNGLAVIIFMAQIEQFKVIENGIATWMQGETLLVMAGLTLLTIAIVLVFPKFFKAIPSSLVAIMLIFALVYFFDINTK